MEKSKKSYQTEQKKQLLQFLKEHKSQQYTIDEIVSRMEGDKVPGKSTVYRLMKQLVDEELVKRSNVGNSRQFTYQLLDGERCSHHLHMQCESCGKLFHLQEQASRQVEGLLNKNNEFALDVGHCILYGTCKTCNHKGE